MPRADRILVEGGLYHVYNRLGRGEQFFQQEAEARQFVSLLREVVERDSLTVYAWCLMSNHYHLAVRTGAVPLDRPIHSLQQRVTRGINARNRVYGPLWQGRYRSKVVNDQRYLDQLLVYIHLNPIMAGIVDDPADYPWSGHLELLGKIRPPIVDLDEVLRVFGNTRRAARAAYVRRLKGSLEETWIGEEPGHLPWWRIGRPPKSEDEDPEIAINERRAKEELGPEWRPSCKANEFIARAADLLGVSAEDLRSRKRAVNLVQARETILVLGVERWGIKVKDIARVFGKSSSGMSQALSRAVERRATDPAFLRKINDLDRALARVQWKHDKPIAQ